MDATNIRHQILMQDEFSKIRWSKGSESNLGPTTSCFIHLSLDKKEDWINGIFHNSRYAIFSIQNGKLELISKGLGMPKFRKSNAKSNEDVAAKIVRYCYSV